MPRKDNLDGAPDNYVQPYDFEHPGPYEYPIINDEWCSKELTLPKSTGPGGSEYFRWAVLVGVLLTGFYLDASFSIGMAFITWAYFFLYPTIQIIRREILDTLAASGSNVSINNTVGEILN